MRTHIWIAASIVGGAIAWLLLPESAPSAGHAESQPAAAATVQMPVEPAPAAVTGDDAPAAHDQDEMPGTVPLPEGRATVAEIHAHDEVPSIPRDDAPVPENDPIEPEAEQTPAWRAEKTRHAAELVERQAERLDARVAAAETAGDPAEVRRLRVQADRARKRLETMRADAAALQAEADGEPVAAAP